MSTGSIGLLNKYVWLVETIYRAGRITRKEINEKWLECELSEGVDISRRTFINNINAIEELFDIVISHDCLNRYYIEDDSIFNRGTSRSWLLNAFSVNAMVGDSKKLRSRVVLEELPSGQNYLETVIKAMRDNRVLNISYFSYTQNEVFDFEIHPYFVKVFKRRWYVIAYSPLTDDMRVYALDRMKKIEILQKVFKMPGNFEPQDYFKDCFGILNTQTVPVERVVVRTTERNARYLRGLPLHASQKELEKDGNMCVFEYHLKPEFDFIQEILASMDALEVMEPQWLREKLAATVKAMNKIYNGK